MSAFDTLTKIKQAVEHPKTDHQLPKARSLAWKAIAGKTAIPGTKGDHIELVHGDHWKEVKGNETKNVQLNQKITVKGNHKETLVGRTYQNIIGPHIIQNNNVRNETRLAKYTEIYGDNEHAADASGNSDSRKENFEFLWDSVAIHVTDLTVIGFGGTVYGIAFYAAGLDTAVIAMHAEVVLNHSEIHCIHAESHNHGMAPPVIT